MHHLLPLCVNEHLIGCSWASCGIKMLASWHNARVDQKHLFALLMNQLYATDVPGLQGQRGRRENLNLNMQEGLGSLHSRGLQSLPLLLFLS